VLKNGAHVMVAMALMGLMAVPASGCGQTASSATNAATSSAATTAPLLAVVSPAQAGPCLVDTQYTPGSQVVFRIQVMDPTTGQPLTSRNLSAVNVVLPNGTQIPARFGTHEGGTTPFWVAKWTVPGNYPTGEVRYTVSVQGSHRTVKRVSFDVTDPEAHLTIVNGKG
jgi:hypothetical protein